MSKYKTGELAKLCGITVRTVQYYDTRGILTPSELSEGGRRLYSDDDLTRLRIICFLRETGMSIDSISQLFNEEQPENVISILIEEQEKVLRHEIDEYGKKLSKLNALKSAIKGDGDFSVDSISDIALITEDKKKLSRVRLTTLIAGIPFTLLEWTSVILWITAGIWWPFVVYTLSAVPFGILISRYYFNNVAYICPQCHEVFRPTFKDMFWAKHTPKTRKLTCTCCGHHGFCVEIYSKKEPSDLQECGSGA